MGARDGTVAADAETVAAVVFAGGEGRRMGGDKPLRLLRGRSLIEHALQLAASYSDTVAVVVRQAAQAERLPPATMLLDTPGLQGPLAALHAAMRFATAERRRHLLTLPCDTPRLPPDFRHRLHAAIGDNVAAIAATGGRLHPATALWRSDSDELLLEYWSGGGRSLRGFGAFAGHVVVAWDDYVPDPFFNVNTVAELEALEAAGG